MNLEADIFNRSTGITVPVCLHASFACLLCVLYMNICMPCMHALYVCLTDMPYRYAFCVYASRVCFGCKPWYSENTGKPGTNPELNLAPNA